MNAPALILFFASTCFDAPSARLELDGGPILVGIPVVARVTIDDVPGRSVEPPRAGIDAGEFVVLDATTLRDGSAVVARVTLMPTVSGEQTVGPLVFIVESSDGDRTRVVTEPFSVVVQSALAPGEIPELRDAMEPERFDDVDAATRSAAWWVVPAAILLALGVAWASRRRRRSVPPRRRATPRIVVADPPEAIALRALEALADGGDARALVAAAGEVVRTYLESDRREHIRPRTAAELASAIDVAGAADTRPIVELMFAAERARYSDRSVARSAADASVSAATEWLRARLDRRNGAVR